MLMSHCLFHGTQLKVKMKYTKKCRQLYVWHLFDAVEERAGKEKKKVAIDFCLLVLYSFQQILRQTKTNSFFFFFTIFQGMSLRASCGFNNRVTHILTTILIAALCAVLLLLFLTCLGHLLTTTRHCRHSLDIFTLSKMRTFHTVDTCNTPVT